MSQFQELFKKVNGKAVLKDYARSHVLFYALCTTLLNGLDKKGLEIVRLGTGHKVYRRLQKENRQFIADFKKKQSSCSVSHEHSQIIWTIWLQGMDQAPWIVQQCYASMQRCHPDKKIVVITEDNYSQYVAFPDYIMERYHKGIISKVHFADLLRIELLAVYGGTWMDGTVYCTPMKETQRYMLDSDLFLFQILKPGLDGHSAAISSWFMTASSNQDIILLTRALLHNYWKTHDYAVDYFILHYFFQLAIEAYPEQWARVIPFSNAVPHMFLLRFFQPYHADVWQGIQDQTPFHKLSYKYTPQEAEQPGTFFDQVLHCQNRAD